MKNTALKGIPNHCTLKKFQHQRYVLVYHWLIPTSKICTSIPLVNSNIKDMY